MDVKELRFLKEEDARRVNAMLQEGLFFHRGDHERLFEVLHTNADQFRDFWKKWLDTDLVVKEHYAYRRHDNTEKDAYAGFRNPAVPNAGRWHFGWHGHNGKVCMLIFMSFLYWYETVLRTTTPDRNGEHAFVDHNFWVFLQERLDDFFAQKPEARPKPAVVEKCFARIFSDMETFSFIREVDKRDIEDRRGADRHGFRADVMRKYLARPGLTAYDPTVLQQNPSQFEAAFFGSLNGADDSEGEEE